MYAIRSYYVCRKCVVECPTNAIVEVNFPPRKPKTDLPPTPAAEKPAAPKAEKPAAEKKPAVV